MCALAGAANGSGPVPVQARWVVDIRAVPQETRTAVSTGEVKRGWKQSQVPRAFVLPNNGFCIPFNTSYLCLVYQCWHVCVRTSCAIKRAHCPYIYLLGWQGQHCRTFCLYACVVTACAAKLRKVFKRKNKAGFHHSTTAESVVLAQHVAQCLCISPLQGSRHSMPLGGIG